MTQQERLARLLHRYGIGCRDDIADHLTDARLLLSRGVRVGPPILVTVSGNPTQREVEAVRELLRADQDEIAREPAVTMHGADAWRA